MLPGCFKTHPFRGCYPPSKNHIPARHPQAGATGYCSHPYRQVPPAFSLLIVRYTDVVKTDWELTIRIVSGPSELSQALLRITCKCNPGGSHVPGKFILSITVWDSADLLSSSKHHRQVCPVVASAVMIQA